MSSIVLNGSHYNLGCKSCSLYELFERLEYHSKQCVVELNGELLHKDSFSSATINEHDEVEILHFMGGG
ncbi:thiamine biosynthesis protein ThiS [Candidatus Marinamargulisbacteria bacterium SCGC AG-343-D04]|nr:thiamine biosynthesis protein ThiS [Candidatus Marinamargulisbacteria bacterium SCGC AG-343-D04]